MPATKTRVITRGSRHTGYYHTPDGSWLSAGTFNDKAVARVKAQHEYESCQQASWINPKGSKTSLRRYADETWFPSLVVEAKTMMGYSSIYRNHVEPVFGGKELGRILYTEVKTWLTSMEDEGVGRCTQRQAYVVLSQILKAAMRDRLISNLPTAGVKLRPIPKPLPLIFSPDQFAAFLDTIPAYWKPLIEVGVDTGMRASELRGLTPSQVNWGRKTIRIDRATVQLAKTHDLGQFLDKAYPKGARPRTIRVSDSTLRHIAKAMKSRALAPDSTERVFVTEAGVPIGVEHLTRIFSRACASAGVPTRTFKHLRSTKASWMLTETGDLIGVKNYLGHANVATTEKYLGLAEETDEDDNVVSYEDYLE